MLLLTALAAYLGMLSPLYSHTADNVAVRYFTEAGISQYMSGNFYAAIDDFTYVVDHSDSLSEDTLAAYLMRALAYRQLGKSQESDQDIAFLQAYDPLSSNEYFLTSHDAIVACQRKCDVAEKTAYAVCGSLTLKGFKGVLGSGACAAIVALLSQQCGDCCVEGFDNCGNKLETLVKDLLDATFPADSSILDSP